jgi:multiple sugar transport system ATP-binding protein
MNFVDVTLDTSSGSSRLVGANDWSIPLPKQYKDAAVVPGRSLVAGFRPEHLDIGEASSDVGTFRARADVVEYLGNEELLHLNAADKDIVAIVDSEHRVRPGDIVNLVLPLTKVHLFDAETGMTVAPDLVPVEDAPPAVIESTAAEPTDEVISNAADDTTAVAS